MNPRPSAVWGFCDLPEFSLTRSHWSVLPGFAPGWVVLFSGSQPPEILVLKARFVSERSAWVLFGRSFSTRAEAADVLVEALGSGFKPSLGSALSA